MLIKDISNFIKGIIEIWIAMSLWGTMQWPICMVSCLQDYMAFVDWFFLVSSSRCLEVKAERLEEVDGKRIIKVINIELNYFSAM